MKKSANRGFTLVELSVVLVVIGLMIGAILIAKSMVSAVQVQNTVRQAIQFDIAITDFKTKYDKPPGDSPAFPFQSGGEGDGNGMVEDDSGTAGLGRTWTGEVANFWPELNMAGLKSEFPYTATINGGFLSVDAPTPNMPAVTMGIKGTGIFFSNDNGFLSSHNISSVYILGKVSNNDGSDLSFPHTAMTAGEMTIGDAFTPSDLLALDTKIDDGKPNSGIVLAFSTLAAGAADGCYTTGTAAYNTSTGKYACSAAVKYPSTDIGDLGGSSGITCGGGAVYADTEDCLGSGGNWDECSGSCNGCANGLDGNHCAAIGPSCGDLTCNGGENSNTCPEDCGCPPGKCGTATMGVAPGCLCNDSYGCSSSYNSDHVSGTFNPADGTCDCGIEGIHDGHCSNGGGGTCNPALCLNGGLTNNDFPACTCTCGNDCGANGSRDPDCGCSCLNGYTDPLCSTPPASCVTSCLNGGTADNNYPVCTCTCSNNCNGNGTINADCSCSCLNGYTGNDCSTPPSCSNSCVNGGHPNNDYPGCTCSCSNGCSGHGTLNGDCSCTCDANYSGGDCSTPTLCSTICQNSGTPNNDYPTCSCSCSNGYSGNDCSISPTCNTTCQNGGNPNNDYPGCTCSCNNNCGVNGTLSPTCGCSCSNGYSGNDCSTPPSCGPDPGCSFSCQTYDATPGICSCTGSCPMGLTCNGGNCE